ncbi:hypothetical protein BWD09_11915 [Neisseria dentiae]|uniref:Type IV secretion system protein n=3 Tax=Neisseria dentiae TaxID=194197 RepID=A0A1X3D2B6_9NEIS|nr:type IV secretion system protein [Neisseria dentiae]OSI13915.1 hypothetical protein BWD09_11915 [Neisseria dentiae]QMT44354.1 type IV secretion system protein [Neisseria dentiae]STZ50041.1 TrbL/VirB6 plasmid conjugal transfer protein [Neisseria dentiae]
MSSDNLGLFIFVKLYLEKLITDFGDNGLQAVSYVFMPAVGTMVMVWVMFEGYRILNGQGKEPITALFWKTGKVVLITFIAGWIMGNTGAVREWLNGNIKDNIARMISGSEYGSPEAMVDASLMMMHMVTAMFGGLHTAVGTESGGASAMTTFITMSGVGQGAPAVVAGSLLLLNQIAISLCILTAPAFILCLLYEPTKQYFQGWLKFFLGALLTLGVLSAMVVIGLKVTLAYGAGVLAQYATSQALGSGGSGIAQTAMTQGGLGLMMSTLMITAPMMVGNMIGTALGSFTAYNAFTNTSQARDANGNLMPQARAEQQNSSRDAEMGGGGNYNPVSQAVSGGNQLINQQGIKQSGSAQKGAAV